MSSTVPCRFRIFWASARTACSTDSPSCRFGLASARPIAFSRLLAAALRYVAFRASRGVLMARQKNSSACATEALRKKASLTTPPSAGYPRRSLQVPGPDGDQHREQGRDEGRGKDLSEEEVHAAPFGRSARLSSSLMARSSASISA